MTPIEYIAVLEGNNSRAKSRLASAVSDIKTNQPNTGCSAHGYVVNNAEATLGAIETVLDNQLLQARFQTNGLREGWRIGFGPFKASGRSIKDFIVIATLAVVVYLNVTGGLSNQDIHDLSRKILVETGGK